MNSSSSHPGSAQQTNDVERTFVRVWHAASSTAEPGPLERCCEQWLDDNDLRRAQLLRRPTTRNQHVIGRGMARRLLGSDAVDPQSIRFALEAHGKPYVSSPAVAKQLFNLAHTDGLVMCGIGDQRHEALGVDVERLDRRTDLALAERYFSQPEIGYLKDLPCEEARRLAFLKIWTLKESFIKAIGTGLRTPLADFAFDDIASDSPSIRMLNPNLASDHSWKFYSIEPRAGFIGAIAVATKHSNPVVELELCCFEEIVA